MSSKSNLLKFSSVRSYLEGKQWSKIPCNEKELQLKATLSGGQSFRWKQCDFDNSIWLGVFSKRLWFLRKTAEHLEFHVIDKENAENPKGNSEFYVEILRNYFQLDVDIESYYKKWSSADKIFCLAAQNFYGIRILKQEVVENIFSFICSSNNHISRISSMVEKLANFYGEPICEIDGQTYHAFPELTDFDTSLELKLKENGFGYRAKYIAKTVETINAQDAQKWLKELKLYDYKDAKTQLMTLTGIGAKVADCICLMSLGHLSAIPVDTHVYQIAARHYLPHLPKRKTVNDKIYAEIGDHFRNLYGPLAGWAHTVLFCADLKKFQLEQ